ncbi:MAG: sigma-54 factor interaction domain-containing protein, partial [Deltaproteobacteria bacterium]
MTSSVCAAVRNIAATPVQPFQPLEIAREPRGPGGRGGGRSASIRRSSPRLRRPSESAVRHPRRVVLFDKHEIVQGGSMGHFEAGANVREPDATRGTSRVPSIIGQSMAMRRLVATVAQVAPKDVTVLVRGETGTGKELIASLVHARSSRSQGPFVRFNCAAIPGELAEAQLFGHVQGAFTGATHALRGFFAQADGGTLVLDEVGELPLAIQAKLLRALQGGEIQPVGAARVERADVRVVACT